MNNQNPLQMIMNIMNAGQNPQAIFQNIMSNSQQAQMLKNYIGQNDPKTMCLQLAKQNGIDPQQLEQLAQKMSGKK